MTNSTFELMRNNLKKFRLAKNISQEQLGEQCGISSDYISEIERGKKTPSLKRLDIIAKALKIELYKFFKDNS